MRTLFKSLAFAALFFAAFQADAKTVDKSVMQKIWKSTQIIQPIKAAPESIKTELICLALNIYHESRNSNLDDKLSTAFVPLERVKKRTGKTVCDVIWEIRYSTQRKRWIPQFSWTKDGRSDIPYESEAWLDAQTLAFAVLHHRQFGIQNPVPGATHYVTIEIYDEVPWAKDMHVVGKRGLHIYMVEK